MHTPNVNTGSIGMKKWNKEQIIRWHRIDCTSQAIIIKSDTLNCNLSAQMTKYIAKKIVGGMAYHLDCIINDVQHDYVYVAAWNKMWVRISRTSCLDNAEDHYEGFGRVLCHYK